MILFYEKERKRYIFIKKQWKDIEETNKWSPVGGHGGNRRDGEMRIFTINVFKVIRYFSHYLFLKSKWKNVYTDVFIPVTSDSVCLSPAAAFMLLPFHWGEEGVFSLHLPVADGEGTFQNLPGLLPSAFHACLALWESPLVDGVWLGGSTVMFSPVLPALSTTVPDGGHLPI